MPTLVFLEHHDGELQKGSLGVLSKAASLGDDVTGVLLGSGVAGLAPEAGKFGAARVLSSHDQSVVLSALALISLAVGAAVGLAAPGSGVVPYVAAAVIAAGSAWIPIKAPSAA